LREIILVLDSRTKILATLGLIAATFLTESFGYFSGIAGLLVLVFLLSKTPLRLFLRNVFLLSWLLVFTFIAHLWGQVFLSHQETTLQTFSIGGIFVTYQGVRDGLLTIGQLVVVVGWVSILGFSASPLQIATSLEHLFRPLRFLGIPVHKFSIVTMLSIRFIPILFEESQHLVRAYIARGIDLNEGTPLVRLKNYVLLCIPVFTSMLRRVDHLTLAMESRAFRVQAERTSLYEFRMRFLDYLVLGGSIVMLVCTQVIP
jgi:energy-coupling factor transport system permease protein